MLSILLSFVFCVCVWAEWNSRLDNIRGCHWLYLLFEVGEFYKKIAKEERTGVRPESINIRMIVNLIYFLGLILCLHLFNFFIDTNTSKLYLILIGSMSGFFCYGSISLLGVIAMEFTPKSFSGSSHAIASLAANLGAISAGLPFSLIAKLYSFKTGFVVVEFITCFVLVVLIVFKGSKSKFEVYKSYGDRNVSRKNQ